MRKIIIKTCMQINYLDISKFKYCVWVNIVDNNKSLSSKYRCIPQDTSTRSNQVIQYRGTSQYIWIKISSYHWNFFWTTHIIGINPSELALLSKATLFHIYLSILLMIASKYSPRTLLSIRRKKLRRKFERGWEIRLGFLGRIWTNWRIVSGGKCRCNLNPSWGFLSDVEKRCWGGLAGEEEKW